MTANVTNIRPAMFVGGKLLKDANYVCQNIIIIIEIASVQSLRSCVIITNANDRVKI